MRRMIAAAVMFCDSAIKVFSGADVVAPGGATQNVSAATNLAAMFELD